MRMRLNLIWEQPELTLHATVFSLWSVLVLSYALVYITFLERPAAASLLQEFQLSQRAPRH